MRRPRGSRLRDARINPLLEAETLVLGAAFLVMSAAFAVKALLF
jgi:hypothetical protein